MLQIVLHDESWADAEASENTQKGTNHASHGVVHVRAVHTDNITTDTTGIHRATTLSRGNLDGSVFDLLPYDDTCFIGN